jgi:hypothetical protein
MQDGRRRNGMGRSLMRCQGRVSAESKSYCAMLHNPSRLVTPTFVRNVSS